MRLTERDCITWGLAVASVVAGVAAAWVKGGAFEALTATSTGLMGLAVAWGYTGKPPASPKR
jgi:hypothetical protein